MTTMMKNVLIALGLCIGCSALNAQNIGTASTKVSPSDTLFVIEEEALINSLQKLAGDLKTSSLEKQHTEEDMMQILRYQLMLNLLSPKDPAVIYQVFTNEQSVANTKSNKETKTYDARLSRLEQMLETLLKREAQPGKTSLIVQNSKANTTPAIQKAQPAKQDSVSLKQQRTLEALEAQLAAAESRLKQLEANPNANIELPSLIQGLTAPSHTVQTVHTTDTVTRNIVSDFKRSVYFSVGSHKVDELARNTLNEAVSFLKEYPNAKLSVSGFASPEGNPSFNKQLAERRLNAVVTYLETMGIEKSRLSLGTIGIDTTRSGYQLARRVDLSLLDK